MYLIVNGGLKGFTPQEIQIIANIARYHRKSPPKPEHEAFASLPARAREIVLCGAALLRICDGLDRSHCGVVNDLQIVLGNRRVRIRLQAHGDTELELWAARRKMDVFEQFFHRTLSFAPAHPK
jgi:exopolyphosphatase/guanosine-5'-triphosphate,3'-diphosphate pyrophosphatase